MTIAPRLGAALAVFLFLSAPYSSRPRATDCNFQSNQSPTAIPEGLGVNIHFTDPKPGELKMLSEAGVRWVRMDFKWDLTEQKKGEYDFGAYDRLMFELSRFGLRALFILDYGNPLYEGGAPPRTDTSRRAFAGWAVAAAKRFAGRGVIWEVYNEPNNDMFWSPKPNVNEYAALALAVGRAFREHVPKEKIIGPAVGEMDFAFLEGCFKAGLLEYWSAVSVHPYLRTDPELVASDYCRLKELIKKYAPRNIQSRSGNPESATANKEIPIISSEWGYSSAWPGMNEAKQGELLARQWLVNQANGVSVSIWYDWQDDGSDRNDPEHHFGMVVNDYHKARDPVYDPKPAYQAAKTLTSFFGGYRFQRRLNIGDPNDFVLVFENGDSQRFAAWTRSGEKHEIQIPVKAGRYAVVGHTGEKVGVIVVERQGIHVTVSSAPTYIR